MIKLRTLQDIDVTGRHVLVRVDFNVPLKDDRVADDNRIRAALPTIRYLREHRAKIALMSHLGRPKGKVRDELRLDQVAERLSELLGAPVKKLNDCVGPDVEVAMAQLGPGDAILLENLRFHPGEEANDPAFAEQLARLGDIYVNDAFGTAHRAHASTVGVARLLPSAAGLLLEREVEMLGRLTHDPKRPYLAMVGGAKLSSKIKVLRDLLPRVDGFLLGGGIVFTLLRVQGLSVGRSLVDESLLPEAAMFLEGSRARGTAVELPRDVVVAPALEPNAPTQVASIDRIPEDQMGLDIGPETIEIFRSRIREARSLLWAGPLGAFEVSPFHQGTAQIARAIVESDAFAVIGGGDTAAALKAVGIEGAENIYVSTGGGAALAFVSGRTLPALEVLQTDRE
jgi:phosphoglycerate kinase